MSIQRIGECDALEMEWWDLWRRDPAASPFQSPAWLLPWQRQFGGAESFIVTLRRGGRLAALLPLLEHEGRLLLWGAGTSDWLDGIVDPMVNDAELAAVFTELREPLDLFQLRDGSRLLNLPLPAGWYEHRAPSECCVSMALPWKPSKSMARNLRYYRRRADRAGIGRPEHAGAAGFDELVELHGRRWNERGLPGVLAEPRIQSWHRQALPRLEAAGLLRLYLLRSRSRAVAALYVLSAKGAAFYYVGGFDPEFAELGLGTILIGHAIAEAEREGAKTFEFLRGGEAYKYHWGGCDEQSHARFLQPPEAQA